MNQSPRRCDSIHRVASFKPDRKSNLTRCFTILFLSCVYLGLLPLSFSCLTFPLSFFATLPVPFPVSFAYSCSLSALFSPSYCSLLKLLFPLLLPPRSVISSHSFSLLYTFIPPCLHISGSLCSLPVLLLLLLCSHLLSLFFPAGLQTPPKRTSAWASPMAVNGGDTSRTAVSAASPAASPARRQDTAALRHTVTLHRAHGRASFGFSLAYSGASTSRLAIPYLRRGQRRENKGLTSFVALSSKNG